MGNVHFVSLMLRCGLIVFKINISFFPSCTEEMSVCMYVSMAKVSDNKSSKNGILPCPALIVVKSLKGGYNYLHVLKYAHVVDLSDLK